MTVLYEEEIDQNPADAPKDNINVPQVVYLKIFGCIKLNIRVK